MSAKRKCHFSDDYTKEWSFVKEGRTDEEALCAISNHKKKFAVVSTSSPTSKFMIKQDTQEALLITAAELTTAYIVVKHHQSFSSLDCIVKLNAMMYSDSKIAAKQSTARTKATAIVNNILTPHSVSEIKKNCKEFRTTE
ncbi:hypothetical protein QTP88_014166 [Uroleucon formosanum]